MKSREELLKQAEQVQHNKRFEKYCEIRDKLENAVTNGYTSVKVVVEQGENITKTTLLIATDLKEAGFYIRYFCDVERSTGYTVNYIEVSLLPFKKENKNKNIKEVVLLCAIIIPVMLIILFYVYGKV